MSATGTYRFYLDGVLVGEQTNIITTLGKQAILRYLAGIAKSYYGGLALGSGASTATVGQTDLDFEYARTRVSYASVDYTNNTVIYKGTIGVGLAGKIYEAGLFSKEVNVSAGQYSSRLLSTFDTDEPWSNITSLDITNNRVGTQSILDDIVTSGGTVLHENNQITLDLSGYSVNDQFAVAFTTYYDYVQSLTLTFTNLSGTTFVGTFLPNAHTAGSNNPQYQIIKLQKSSFSNLGGDWSSIVKAGVLVTAKSAASGTNRAKVSIDGIRAFDTDTINPDYVLVSRSVVGSPIPIVANQTLDVEYSLRFDI